MLISFGCILLLLLIGSIYSRNFLSFDYLMQQLKVASFLGVIATGMMLVILLGQIVRSSPTGQTSVDVYDCVVLCTGLSQDTALEFTAIGSSTEVPYQQERDPRRVCDSVGWT